MNDAIDDIKTMPFETAMAELEKIVASLETGQVALEHSISLYERGELLKKHCENLLQNAEMRIQKITLAADGQAKAVEPLDVE